MGLFHNDKTNQIKGHLSNLIAVALSDGTLDASEWNRIVTISALRGISEEALNTFKENIHNAKFRPPTEFNEKIKQIYELVEVMMADGVIETEELEICRKLSERYNLHPRIINDMLERIPQLIQEGKPPHLIISEITDAQG